MADTTVDNSSHIYLKPLQPLPKDICKRIGVDYQTNLPYYELDSKILTRNINNKNYKSTYNNSSSSGDIIWSISKFYNVNNKINNFNETQMTNDQLLDDYIKYVKSLFNKENYDEERALYFLSKCNYDTNAAKLLLDLSCKTDEEDFDSDDEDEDECFICTDGGPLVCCDFAGCPKVYHLKCIGLDKNPNGEFICSWHKCSQCSKDAVDGFRCTLCTTAFCDAHLPNNLRELAASDEISEFFCSTCYSKNKSSKDKDAKSDYGFIKRLEEVLTKKSIELPDLDNKLLDYFQFYKAVVRRGGLSNVINNVGWRGVLLELGLSPTSENSIELKKQYLKFLYPYERKYFNGSIPNETLKNLWMPSKNNKTSSHVAAKILASPNKNKKANRMGKTAEVVVKPEQKSRAERLTNRNNNIVESDDAIDAIETLSNLEPLIKKRKLESDEISPKSYVKPRRPPADIDVPTHPDQISMELDTLSKQVSAVLRHYSVMQCIMCREADISQPILCHFLKMHGLPQNRYEVMFNRIRGWLINFITKKSGRSP